MQLYIVLGTLAGLLAVVAIAYVTGRNAGKTAVREGNATAEADKRRQDDEIDQKPMRPSEADELARRLAAARELRDKGSN